MWWIDEEIPWTCLCAEAVESMATLIITSPAFSINGSAKYPIIHQDTPETLCRHLRRYSSHPLPASCVKNGNQPVELLHPHRLAGAAIVLMLSNNNKIGRVCANVRGIAWCHHHCYPCRGEGYVLNEHSTWQSRGWIKWLADCRPFIVAVCHVWPIVVSTGWSILPQNSAFKFFSWLIHGPCQATTRGTTTPVVLHTNATKWKPKLERNHHTRECPVAVGTML